METVAYAFALLAVLCIVAVIWRRFDAIDHNLWRAQIHLGDAAAAAREAKRHLLAMRAELRGGADLSELSPSDLEAKSARQRLMQEGMM